MIQEIRYQVGEAWKGTYNAATVYGNASVVQDPTGLSVYRSLKSGNVGHPLTDQQWWFCIIDMSSIKAEADHIIELDTQMTEHEAERVENEETRISHENARINAENARISAENARANAESARVQAEQNRVTQENLRVNQEQARVAAEQQRVAKEQQRVSQEASRVAAETQRQLNENNREAVFAEDHAVAVADHTQATEDHTRAESDHETAVQDHAQMTELVERADADHEQAESDHTRAESDHTTAVSDHTQAGNDHTRAGQDHTQAGNDHTRAEEDHTASAAATEAATEAAAAANALQENLENGTVIPALADNLASWAGSTQNANYTQEGVVETTGGNLSIDSSVPATLMSIAAKTDFSATKLIATGFNLLRRATAVGNGWYFMVPALPFGTINTASQPNGVLFTNAQGENLRPTVYFKPLTGGVPTGVTDGSPCTYTDATSNGKSYRFFTTSQAGYLIVSGIDRAATCAHIGWSKRYDEYIAVNNASDAGSEVDIAAGIHALHSYDKMLTVGNVADRIERSGDNQITWHRLVDRVQPTWTNTPVESEGEPAGDYIHTATISGMKSDGAAAFETLGIALLVNGTTVSFTDQNESVQNDYVKYELAAEVTGTAAVSSSFQVEDWGLIIIQDAVGSAYINIAYAQGIPDSVRQMLSNIDNKTIPVIAEALLYLYNENKALRELLTGKNNAVLPYIKAQTIECVDKMTVGAPDILESSVAGAPSAANIPDNWNEETMTVWNGCPRKIGQQYVDKVSKKVYYAVAVTGSTSDWIPLN